MRSAAVCALLCLGSTCAAQCRTGKTIESTSVNGTCPSDAKCPKAAGGLPCCQITATTYECCSSAEACIVNVGCRCFEERASGALSTSAAAAVRPCDLFAAGGTPCVAAHSTVRALYGAYKGPFYRVQRGSDGVELDVRDAAAHDAFCAGDTSTIIRIYDQSPRGNHLYTAPGGGHNGTADAGVNATAAPVVFGGKKAYGAKFEGGMGYRNDNTTGVAVGDEPETIYMVVSGTHYNGKCCFDYGNAEIDDNSHGPGTMEAVYFGSADKGLNHGGAGAGPWVMADLEAGLWGADVVVSNEPSINHAFVTAMVKGGSTAGTGGKGRWAIKAGDAAAGGLEVYFDGARPNRTTASTGRWPNRTDAPMMKQGAIILGIGGDNSNGAVGTFYEGCMTQGYATDSTDAAVQANIVAGGYALYPQM